MHQVDPDAGWRTEDVEHLVFPSAGAGSLDRALTAESYPVLASRGPIRQQWAACSIDVGQPASEVEVRRLARHRR
jgi:hypothetical protein